MRKQEASEEVRDGGGWDQRGYSGKVWSDNEFILKAKPR